MKTVKKLLISICFMFLFIILSTIKSNASSDLHLNELAFDANINSDGSIKIMKYRKLVRFTIPFLLEIYHEY